ncbi:hypothetical protein RRG08_058112 [Elysia crispata]|uniref:Uncharacterized protein n=1 Tax=Elysia crispata TaxID=231223 RepID=A0AAE1D6U3_9GAST|nr:hypothetical protein RRG08_058112 [Elysia crispata]
MLLLSLHCHDCFHHSSVEIITAPVFQVAVKVVMAAQNLIVFLWQKDRGFFLDVLFNSAKYPISGQLPVSTNRQSVRYPQTWVLLVPQGQQH